jgi:soluble lytic murein transglycosylase-like protein
MLAGVPSPASAQIYSWKDADGVLVLSDRPRAGGVDRTFGPPKMVRAATPLAVAMTTSGYEPLIRQHASLQGVRADLVRAVIQVESAFNPWAVSPKGAMGLMQLMPSTAARFGVRDPFNPSENIRAGVGYLRQLLDRYDNNEQLALAAYNAGPGAVDKYGSKVPPYKETQNYVKRITAIKGTTGTRIYKIVEVVDGREVVRYTDKKPETGPVDEVAASR